MDKRVHIKSFNMKSEVEDFINDSHISKDQIINFFEESTGLFTLAYYA